MADQHKKGNGEVVRGQDERTPLTSDDPAVEPGDDLAGIRADDALLDALGGRAGEQPASFADDELNALLMSWRREVDSSPMGELVDTETAVATIAAARPVPRGRHRFLIPLASAAAVLAIAFTGVSLVARDAQPGDPFWGLTRVLYADHARSVEAAVAVRGDLATARTALREGRVDEARDALAKAGQHLPSVSSDDGKEELIQTHESLMDRLTGTAPTSPAGTPTSQPGTPVPSSPAPTDSPTTTTEAKPTSPTTTVVEPSTTAPTTSSATGETEQPVPLPTDSNGVTSGESKGELPGSVPQSSDS